MASKSNYIPGVMLSFLLLFFISFLLYKLLFFQNPKDIFTSYPPYVLHLLRFTIFQATLSVILSLFFGIMLSWSLTHLRNLPFRDTVISLFSSALVLPSIVVVLGVITVFGKHGWINDILLSLFGKDFGGYIYGLGGILFAHVYFNASYASRVFLDAFESIPKQRYKLSKNIGLNIWQRFYYIELPSIKPYIPGLASTVFLLCFSSFIIVLVLGGTPAYNTLEVAIYEALKFDFDIPLSIKLSFLQIFISTILLFFASKRYTPSNISIAFDKNTKWLETKKELLYHKIIILSFFTVFILPLLAIVINGIHADFVKLFREREFIKAFLTSISVATVSSLSALFVSLLLSFAKANIVIKSQIKKSYIYIFLEKIITLSSSIYLIVPSIVLGVGFFIISQSFSLTLHFTAITALIFANTLLALPFAFNTLYPQIFQIKSKYDKTIVSIGIGFFSKFFYIYLPNLKRQIIYTVALSFSFSLGDLSIIALFGDKDMATLPWYLYQKMGSYKTDDAAGIALLLLVLVLCIFLITLKAGSVRDK
jgi:thiamine transport system permease protein